MKAITDKTIKSDFDMELKAKRRFIMRNFSLLLIGYVVVMVFITIHLMCSKNPAEPELPPDDPCLECPPVEIEVPCKSINLIVRFFLGGNNSFPDLYIFEREGFADEEIRIVSIDTSFVRILDNYTNETYGLRVKSGSAAQIVRMQTIGYECQD